LRWSLSKGQRNHQWVACPFLKSKDANLFFRNRADPADVPQSETRESKLENDIRQENA